MPNHPLSDRQQPQPPDPKPARRLRLRLAVLPAEGVEFDARGGDGSSVMWQG
jgi:hypothetical protein